MLAIVWLAAATASAGDDPVRIVRIEPLWPAETLAVQVQLENLFSSKIEGTIRSGLPCIIDVEVKLRESGRKWLNHARYLQRLTYDIWNEIYLLERPDTTLTFTDFDAATRSASHITVPGLIAIEKLDTGRDYTIAVQAAISPISTLQNEKLASWLQNTSETRTDVTSQERSSGFAINFSRFISFFLGDARKRAHISGWQEKTFRWGEEPR